MMNGIGIVIFGVISHISCDAYLISSYYLVDKLIETCENSICICQITLTIYELSIIEFKI